MQAQQSGDDYDEDEDSDAGSAATLTLADEEDRWRAIGHGSVSGPAGLSAARQGDDNSSMGSMGHGSDDRDIEEVSVAQSRFTEYSMTSSILPRSEHQVIHNEHFEAMYAAVRATHALFSFLLLWLSFTPTCRRLFFLYFLID